ncbi:MAG: hypothetical protein C0481_04280 [Phenylobacterium sp.]|uniref:DUF6886 family protein n=1 Tax=Phenylobacterium sp. TaxID=1871053 RepID=UPI0025D6CB06|nr:DUF6886 family protein [Phenylobacterium sp.]MBA4011063.1 hypothetical protein [Phenylobacterium sp.]
MRLFHFSEDPGIARFEPRPVRTPSARPPGREWLNGPLVWAIDEPHQAMYLFPRDCPRILLWPTAATTPQDRAAWWGESAARMLAHVEQRWLEVLTSARLYRYELPPDSFDCLDDAGMWVSREPVTPFSVEEIADLPAALAACDAELRVVDSLTPLRGVWDTTLHASGIRLRNAAGW